MKVGKPITYYDASGVASPASCLKIVGEGPVSGNKVLDVKVDGASTVENVPHKADAPTGHYWTLVDDTPRAEVSASPSPVEPPVSIEVLDAVEGAVEGAGRRGRAAKSQDKQSE